MKFVSFVLTEEEKKLTGKARIDVLQKLADNANDFTDALQVKGADFDPVAKKFNLTPKETDEFTAAVPPRTWLRRRNSVQGGLCPHERSAEQRCHSVTGRLSHLTPASRSILRARSRWRKRDQKSSRP